MTSAVGRVLASANPVVVGAVAAVYGLSSLLLIAAAYGTVSYTLVHPGFWAGDGVALPVTLSAIAHYFRRCSTRSLPPLIPWLSAAVATVYTALQTAYSVYITGNYATSWSFAHSAFIWVLIFAVGYFFATIVVRNRGGHPLPVELMLVSMTITLYLLLALLFGAKVSPSV